jgi:hypothetical protein
MKSPPPHEANRVKAVEVRVRCQETWCRESKPSGGSSASSLTALDHHMVSLPHLTLCIFFLSVGLGQSMLHAARRLKVPEDRELNRLVTKTAEDLLRSRLTVTKGSEKFHQVPFPSFDISWETQPLASIHALSPGQKSRMPEPPYPISLALCQG